MIVAYKNGKRGVFSEVSWEMGKCAEKGWVIPMKSAETLAPEKVQRLMAKKIEIPKSTINDIGELPSEPVTEMVKPKSKKDGKGKK